MPPMVPNIDVVHVPLGKTYPKLEITIALGQLVCPVALRDFRPDCGLFHHDVTGVKQRSRSLFTEARNYFIGSKLDSLHSHSH